MFLHQLKFVYSDTDITIYKAEVLLTTLQLIDIEYPYPIFINDTDFVMFASRIIYFKLTDDIYKLTELEFYNEDDITDNHNIILKDISNMKVCVVECDFDLRKIEITLLSSLTWNTSQEILRVFLYMDNITDGIHIERSNKSFKSFNRYDS